ncbi:GntR family transcriptional regulator [Paracoccus sp. M683]|uniref:GntR family transcriptional regulator n=1 Tax=Paracoccus sp. M683 TaxID=2594268 RepID=UPI00163DB894|nr:GntR family transcriptional regulator [Paracoccus sp. M683]
MSRLSDKAVARLRGVSPDQSGRSTTTWQSVRNEVLLRIRSQEWPAGTLIPTEKQLALEWGCARATINRALRDLADNGIVERRRKVGTRVTAAPRLEASREVSTIRSDIRAQGAEFGYRLLRSEAVAAPPDIARQLQLSDSDVVHHVQGLFLADQAPYCCLATWLNTKALPSLEQVDLSESSAEEWLDHVARPSHSRISIMALPIGLRCAEAMQLQQGMPVLTIERTDWANTTPLAFSRQFFPPGHRLVYED